MFRPVDAVLLMPLTVFVPPLYGYTFGEPDPVPVRLRMADGFDFPVGAPHGRGYYDAQPFKKNHHLGEDWNGNGGGNTDLGDPVFSIANGVVVFAEDLGGGWGNTVRIVHAYRDGNEVEQVESFYAHLDRIDVREGERVRRGEPIGTIGDADGSYIAHLHFELREQVGLPHGPGYSRDTEGWLDPSAFIRSHRPESPGGS